MRRPFRSLRHALVALSAALCVAAAALWVRSYHVKDRVVATGGGRQYWLTSTAGRLETLAGPAPRDQEQKQFPLLSAKPIGAAFDGDPDPGAWTWRRYQWPQPAAARRNDVSGWTWHCAGFGAFPVMLATSPSNVYGGATVHVVPHWAICAVAGVAPLGAVVGDVRRRRRRRRRLAAHHCVRCGYDLRATPGRCPECGATAG